MSPRDDGKLARMASHNSTAALALSSQHVYIALYTIMPHATSVHCLKHLSRDARPLYALNYHVLTTHTKSPILTEHHRKQSISYLHIALHSMYQIGIVWIVLD